MQKISSRYMIILCNWKKKMLIFKTKQHAVAHA